MPRRGDLSFLRISRISVLKTVRYSKIKLSLYVSQMENNKMLKVNYKIMTILMRYLMVQALELRLKSDFKNWRLKALSRNQIFTHTSRIKFKINHRKFQFNINLSYKF
jgi:hypothetical protein